MTNQRSSEQISPDEARRQLAAVFVKFADVPLQHVQAMLDFDELDSDAHAVKRIAARLKQGEEVSLDEMMAAFGWRKTGQPARSADGRESQ